MLYVSGLSRVHRKCHGMQDGTDGMENVNGIEKVDILQKMVKSLIFCDDFEILLN